MSLGLDVLYRRALVFDIPATVAVHNHTVSRADLVSSCRLASYAEFLKTNTWISAVHQETDNEVHLLLSPPGFQVPVTLSVVFDPIKYTLAGAQVRIRIS